MKNEFNQAANRQSSPNRSAENYEGGIATRAELDALKDARDIPLPQLNFEPDTALYQEAEELANSWRENRIAHLSERLDTARERFEHNIDRAFER